MSPPKQSMKESKRAGVSPRRPIAGGSLAFKAGGRGGATTPPPPALLAHVEHRKKMAGSKERWIGPMKRTAKHGVGSPNAACTKSTVREKPVYSRKKSASSRSEPAISEPAPRWHAGDSVRDPRCRRVLRATGNYRHECHMPDTTNTAIDTIQRVMDDTANQPTHAPHTRT